MLTESKAEELLYKPRKEIPELSVVKTTSRRARLHAGLDKLEVNHMMVIKAKDQPYVYQWNQANAPKKCCVRRVGLSGYKVVKRFQ